MPHRPFQTLAAAVLAVALVPPIAAASDGDSLMPAARPADIVGAWVIIAVDEGTIPAGATATLEIAADGAVSGRSACNRYASALDLGADRIIFDAPRSTRMACSPDLMDAEYAILRAFDRIDGARLDGATLELTGGGDTLMTLQRAP